MRAPSEIPLCDYADPSGDQQLIAVVDELTLTYTVVAQNPRSGRRVLCRHLPWLGEARCWATAYCDVRPRTGEASRLDAPCRS
jgi:hypothetical protein